MVYSGSWSSGGFPPLQWILHNGELAHIKNAIRSLKDCLKDVASDTYIITFLLFVITALLYKMYSFMVHLKNKFLF